MLVTVTKASSHLRSETCASRRECLLAHGVAQGKRLHAHERQVPNWRPNSVQAADLFGNTRMRLCHRGSAADAVCNMASFSRCNELRIPVTRLWRTPAAIAQPIS